MYVTFFNMFYMYYYLVNTYNMQYFTSINGHRIKSKYINGFKWPSTDMQPISWVCKPTSHLHIYIKFYYNWWDTWLHFTYSNIFLQTKWRGDNMMFMCNRSLQWRPSSSVQFLYTVHVSVWLRSRRGINTAAFSVSVFALEPNHCRNLLTKKKKNPKNHSGSQQERWWVNVRNLSWRASVVWVNETRQLRELVF